jgi:hypothetical protein
MRQAMAWLDRNELRDDELWILTLRRLAATSRRSYQFPSSVACIADDEITLGPKPISTGQADVYKAEWQGKTVARKVFHWNYADRQAIKKVFQLFIFEGKPELISHAPRTISTKS